MFLIKFIFPSCQLKLHVIYMLSFCCFDPNVTIVMCNLKEIYACLTNNTRQQNNDYGANFKCSEPQNERLRKLASVIINLFEKNLECTSMPVSTS